MVNPPRSFTEVPAFVRILASLTTAGATMTSCAQAPSVNVSPSSSRAVHAEVEADLGTMRATASNPMFPVHIDASLVAAGSPGNTRRIPLSQGEYVVVPVVVRSTSHNPVRWEPDLQVLVASSPLTKGETVRYTVASEVMSLAGKDSVTIHHGGIYSSHLIYDIPVGSDVIGVDLRASPHSPVTFVHLR